MSAFLCNQTTEAWYCHNFHVLQNSFAFSQSYENGETALGNIHMEWLRWGWGKGSQEAGCVPIPVLHNAHTRSRPLSFNFPGNLMEAGRVCINCECLTQIFNLGWKSHEVPMSSSPSAYGGQDRLVILALSWHPGHLACQLLPIPGHHDPINKTKVAYLGLPLTLWTSFCPDPIFPDHFYNTCGQLCQVKGSLLHIKFREFQFLNCTLWALKCSRVSLKGSFLLRAAASFFWLTYLTMSPNFRMSIQVSFSKPGCNFLSPCLTLSPSTPSPPPATTPKAKCWIPCPWALLCDYALALKLEPSYLSRYWLHAELLTSLWPANLLTEL